MEPTKMNDDGPQHDLEPAGNDRRLKYETPSIDAMPIALITRGGTPGAGDSGDIGSQDEPV